MNMSTEDSKTVAKLNSLSDSINFYNSAIVIPIGILFNFLTIFTFLRPRLRKISNMSIFYVALAIYDILSLTNSILLVQLLPTLNIKLVNLSNPMCKFGNIWRKIVTQAPSWIQLIMTFDRFRCVVCPQKFRYLENRLKLISTLVCVFIVLTFINTPFLWYYTAEVKTITNVFDSNSNRTMNMTVLSLSCTISSELGLATDILNVLMRSYIPFVLMIFLNVSMTRRFLRSKKISTSRNRSLKREYIFTLTVFGMSLTFFVFYLPWSVYYVLNRIFQSISSLQTAQIDAQLNIFQSIAFSIAYANNWSLFFVNVVFNGVFRKEFFNMMAFRRLNLASSHVFSTTKGNTMINNSTVV
jgi:hypothetical protein